jgi:hypothetical protein
MKKILLTCLVYFSYIGLSSAQDFDLDSDAKFTIGSKAGLNLSNVYDTKGDAFNADAKFGFAIGAFATIPFGNFLAFQPELLISQKGFQATGYLLGSTYSVTRTTTYLDFPLLFAIRPTQFLTFVLGPQYSYLFNQKDVFGSATTTIEQETAFKNDNIRKNTLCFTGGLDINLNKLVLSGRMGWDLLANNGSGGSQTPRYKNFWYQASIGYRF